MEDRIHFLQQAVFKAQQRLEEEEYLEALAIYQMLLSFVYSELVLAGEPQIYEVLEFWRVKLETEISRLIKETPFDENVFAALKMASETKIEFPRQTASKFAEIIPACIEESKKNKRYSPSVNDNLISKAGERLTLFTHSLEIERETKNNKERENGRKNMNNNREKEEPPVGSKRFHPASSLVDSSKKKKLSNNDNGNNNSKGNGDEKKEKERHPIFDDERMKNIEERMAELILNEILDDGPKVSWADIAGLEFAKKSVMEIVVYPMMRPELFRGIRRPPKGLLLFGPPGTGKTMIGKAIASEAGATFFNISASSLTSKYVGEGEKMVRALFTVARCFPSEIKVIFVDEIDSLLTQRSENDIEASRRIKTEFLVQMDGAGNDPEERLLLVGATNRPQEIDEAARRRFVKRLYIPLPTKSARKHLISHLLKGQKHSLTEDEIDIIGGKTLGYSGSDIHSLCGEAALGPIRNIDDIRNVSLESVRAIDFNDFLNALNGVRSSVSPKDLETYMEWNRQFGSFGDPPTGD